jgi:hypothetical protein
MNATKNIGIKPKGRKKRKENQNVKLLADTDK